ncbi:MULTISPECIES: GntR family transcriptional regulator [unclassified Streptomyces]|uniref:GntR family transcriptional regulator n=1 Tax=unclassified Streptomyces TaxID=2593676 RepID=UPI0038223CDA
MEFDPTRPKWQQIADLIRSRIRSGQYPTAYHLSEVAMQAEFGVARDTVRKATKNLRESGWITTTPGMGSFVADRRDDDQADV